MLARWAVRSWMKVEVAEGVVGVGICGKLMVVL